MARKRWTLTLNMSSIRKTVQELDAYSRKLQPCVRDTVKDLAEYGAQKASEYFAEAQYAGQNDATAVAVENVWGWRVKSQGKAAPFIEYGAGVYYNGSGVAPSYPAEPKIPSGIVPIGTYGRMFGSRQGWIYKGTPGNAGVTAARIRKDGTRVERPGYVFTRGWRPQMCLARAYADIRAAAPDALAKQVREKGLSD